MRKLKIGLQNCYGIKQLDTEFDFSASPVYAIYAPNGSMKSSFAQTFQDLADDIPSKDRVFPSRQCVRNITDENNRPLAPDTVLVIRPYDEEFGTSEKTSTLLVDSKLRKEYEQLHIDVDRSKELFLKALKAQSGSKKDLAAEISSTFTRTPDDFYGALLRIERELPKQKDAPFASLRYDTIFDDKVLSLLESKDVKTAIETYISKYNELLAASTYFKKGVFNFYNASTIAKQLADNGFFDAKHTVNLNGNEKLEITSQKQLEDVISREKESILSDKELRQKFAAFEKLFSKNANTRAFEAYLAENEHILPHLANIDHFKEIIWKSYFKANQELFDDVVRQYLRVEKRKGEIEAEAGKQRTQWESVINIFNDRFFVPFRLTAKNKVSVMLGQEPMLDLGFDFEDGADTASVKKDDLLKILSTGEKKALYVLNIIFEVEARRKAKQETVFVIDDIADSFDYRNKYAIIQYLMEIVEDSQFKQIILTHNFDFFRTVNSRFVGYQSCRMVVKNDVGLTIEGATGIRNVFMNDWKKQFFSDPKKKIASIPFIRNILEYTKSETDSDYLRLTSLLHWKADSAKITEGELDNIFCSVFSEATGTPNGNATMVDVIHKEAQKCLDASAGINFENKIVLSIAIRLGAERFMAEEISDASYLAGITSNQTTKLFDRFKKERGGNHDAIQTIQRVILMTPENIHLNAFMYEPIIDMSDEHLRKLYREVRALR